MKKDIKRKLNCLKVLFLNFFWFCRFLFYMAWLSGSLTL